MKRSGGRPEMEIRNVTCSIRPISLVENYLPRLGGLLVEETARKLLNC
jgi:hypothetical protein